MEKTNAQTTRIPLALIVPLFWGASVFGAVGEVQLSDLEPGTSVYFRGSSVAQADESGAVRLSVSPIDETRDSLLFLELFGKNVDLREATPRAAVVVSAKKPAVLRTEDFTLYESKHWKVLTGTESDGYLSLSGVPKGSQLYALFGKWTDISTRVKNKKYYQPFDFSAIGDDRPKRVELLLRLADKRGSYMLGMSVYRGTGVEVTLGDWFKVPTGIQLLPPSVQVRPVVEPIQREPKEPTHPPSDPKPAEGSKPPFPDANPPDSEPGWQKS